MGMGPAIFPSDSAAAAPARLSNHSPSSGAPIFPTHSASLISSQHPDTHWPLPGSLAYLQTPQAIGAAYAHACTIPHTNACTRPGTHTPGAFPSQGGTMTSHPSTHSHLTMQTHVHSSLGRRAAVSPRAGAGPTTPAMGPGSSSHSPSHQDLLGGPEGPVCPAALICPEETHERHTVRLMHQQGDLPLAPEHPPELPRRTDRQALTAGPSGPGGPSTSIPCGTRGREQGYATDRPRWGESTVGLGWGAIKPPAEEALGRHSPWPGGILERLGTAQVSLKRGRVSWLIHTPRPLPPSGETATGCAHTTGHPPTHIDIY